MTTSDIPDAKSDCDSEMSVSFPAQLLQVLLQSQGVVAPDEDAGNNGALRECNSAFEASNESVLQLPSTTNHSLLRQLASKLKALILQGNQEFDENAAISGIYGPGDSYSEYLRATKNFLRWNLVHQSQQPMCTTSSASIEGGTLSQANDNEDEDDCLEGNPLAVLQQDDMLRVYVSRLTASLGSPKLQEDGRYASLCVLYASYPSDDTRRCEGRSPPPLDYLVQHLSYLQVFSKIMLNAATSQAVQLANLRIFHNLLVSLPSFIGTVSPYRLKNINDDHDGEDNISGIPRSIDSLMDLLLHHLGMRSVDNSDNHENDNSSNRCDEIECEIMRILYVLRSGRTMDAHLLERLVLRPQSRLLAIMLLTDTPTTRVMSMNIQSVLLDILETQVSTVVDQTLLESKATSALTPIVMVIHNMCQNHVEFRAATRNRIFPNPLLSPDNQTDQTQATSRELTKKKMSPDDAPPGTFRNKCIQLLSWTESHTKRWMAELLWIVCDGNAEEYTRRVGFGNAMPLLIARGLVNTPS